jgi:hypothetical protein
MRRAGAADGKRDERKKYRPRSVHRASQGGRRATGKFIPRLFTDTFLEYVRLTIEHTAASMGFSPVFSRNRGGVWNK